MLKRTMLADRIFVGGAVITVNDAQPDAEAVAVAGGKILAVGSRAEMEPLRGPATQMDDLGGHALLPGFIDAHSHVFGVGVQALSANLLPKPDGEVGDIKALQRTMRVFAADHAELVAKTGWLVGFGYDDAQLGERRHPTRDDLDAVSTTTPVLVVHQSAHLGALNSRGLELAGIDASTRSPNGGVIRRRRGSDEPDGVVEEMAFFELLFKSLGKLGAEDNKAILRAGIDRYASFGFTTAQEGRATREAVAAEAALAREDGLAIDLVAYPDIQAAVTSIAPPLLSRSYAGHFRVGGAKLGLDGSPQGKTAWLTKPYLVPPAGREPGYAGYAALPDETTLALVDQAFGSGWQILAHCNGDAAADQFIMAVRAATDKHGKADRRPVMIHAQTVRDDQLDAMVELGIIPSFFGMHTFYWGDWHRDSVLGPERAARISPAASAIERGLIFTQHHDAPVALPSSIAILAAQVNRTTRSGQVLGPNQRVTVMDALRSITRNAAYQYFEEKTKGSLEPGKLADLVVLDKDPRTIDPKALWDLQVMETVKEGRTIFSKSSRR